MVFLGRYRVCDRGRVHTRFAGDGLATALICWMLAKAVAILGVAAGAPTVAVFTAVMAWLGPGRFHQ